MLSLTGWHYRRTDGRGVSTRPNWANLLQLNSWSLILAAYLNWSMEILKKHLCLVPATQKLVWTRLRQQLIFLNIILMLFTSLDCTLLNICSIRQHMLYGCLTTWVKVPSGQRTYIDWAVFRVSTSDNYNDDDCNNNNTVI